MLFLQPMRRFIFFLFLEIVFSLFSCQVLFAQTSNATIYGAVKDDKGAPLEMVNVSIKNYPIGTTSDKKGEYLLRIPTGREVIVVFSIIGYELYEKTLNLSPEDMLELDAVLKPKSEDINEVVVAGQRQTSGNIVKINPKAANAVTDVGLGSVESIIKTLPGVSSSNEMSNQYSVRGGSFDENLVYVNGMEIFRPTLIRAGQQEGMSFVNSDMVSSIEFSAGGFDAKYGDKMSSVLDIQYNRPAKFSASADVSILGAKVHAENISKNKKFTYNIGARYKSYKFLLGTLESKGTYDPMYIDLQGYFTYKLSDKLEVGFLGTAASNIYKFIPESRESRTGIFNDQQMLRVFFEGQEVDEYSVYTGSLNFEYKPVKGLALNLTSSLFRTSEKETYDIIGYYWFNEVGNEGSDHQNDSIFNLSTGYYHDHGRNFMDATIAALDFRGSYKAGNNTLLWGINGRKEIIDDKTREWEFRDSAGYSLPYSNSEINLYYLFNTNYNHSKNRYSAYIQDSYSFPISLGYLMITGGARVHYWDYTNKLSFSPRFSASLRTNGNNDLIARLSFGWYHQPPFYRELKDLYGNVNPVIQTPYSIQAVAGVDLTIVSWDRPFRFTAETYYKSLKDLIPYQYENVRIRYLSDKISKGYAYGLDLKINGEFVSGTQSWISASLMDTKEDIEGDGDHGYIPRPSDQRFKFSMFFQDYLPGLPAYQMHLTGHFITGVPFGLPRSERWTQTARIPPYRRIDIGFIRLLVSDGKNLTGWHSLDKFKDCSVSVELLNLIDIDNVSSYTFIADYEGIYHGIPDRLTGMMLNLKLSASF